MRLALKPYQSDALAALTDYAARVRRHDDAGHARPEVAAWEEVIPADRRYHGVPGFERVPYVCTRLPTGGGKTLLAAHACGAVWRELRGDDAPCVLWIVPGNAVLAQTYNGLKAPHHPLRAAVADGFGEQPEVLTLEEALTNQNALRPRTPAVILCTIHSYRIRERAGDEPDLDVLRKVYRDDGYLLERFRTLPTWAKGYLDVDEQSGQTRMSLANALKLRRPLVVMDEAHHARTPTSFESLARFGPCFVLELTATPQTVHDPTGTETAGKDPKFASNTLHAVSALALKRAGMIKLPVELENRTDWRDVLSAVVYRREQLEAAADAATEDPGLPFLRPVALIQAQAKSSSKEKQHVEVVANALLTFPGVEPEHVARHGQGFTELDGVDVTAGDCPIRYVVTVNALAEGWDCHLAWVLGSIGNTATARAVEQLLGRVLRMPNAKPTGVPALDRAYAVVLTESVMEAAQGLREGMIETLGFDARDATDAVRVRDADRQSELPATAVPLRTAPKAGALPPRVAAIARFVPSETVRTLEPAAGAESAGDDPFRESDQSAGRLEFLKTPGQADLRALRDALPEEDRAAVDAAWEHLRPAGTAARTLEEDADPVRVPQLVVRQGDAGPTLFEPVELETFVWDLGSLEPLPDERAFPAEIPGGDAAVLDVTQTGPTAGALTVSAAGRVRLKQLDLLGEEDRWDEPGLVRWLDRELHRGGRLTGLPLSESQPWLARCVLALIERRGFDLPTLVRRRPALAAAIRFAVTDHGRERTRRAAETLFRQKPDALSTDREFAFELTEADYTPRPEYDPAGGLKFRKHAFATLGHMNGEEALCAAEIDGHGNVARWVRNAEYESHGGFSLPLAPGRFFPDFLVELKSGGVALVEYKNQLLAAVANERFKRDVGEMWADRGGNLARFAWVVDRDWGALHRTLEPV